MKMYNPAHPGKVLKEFIADFTITEIAQRLGITRVMLSRIINEKAPITPDMAIRLSQLLETSSEFWLNLQSQYDIWQLEQQPRFEVKPLFKSEPVADIR
ncbi:plasmid maintenance system antidote protein, XRE family/addiction module antidote protein, HigA family/PSEEN1946 proteic killer active protein [Canicola haemoglobinophilus]|uniref:Plasmid maintenance system antidote protein, XRE family/addiction module antidote protein, HigA family/PSEEN1946 proteic killer active protein n=1 Tax=Canicola haemoglobinophilus TaxID=733 RepID=A0AB38H9E9_9PAST|nr:HigA family addiction module antitoxin [Canicola haemoglobinophilus]STO54398.1 plasmid maintenance system antidote protein, XRE family/addiction module antidote protein, HigA family/PSEEN1946 proteic killer active protein [Canicola haemoglobinophilus]STO68932.1 plasmid maintenance system antidote protein, XRE family/addiction module antidote protein, HigA family/PSEEN1946 proteic killer active protein [Canicola haemoglobinophilus]